LVPRRDQRAVRLSTAISSAILRRCSAALRLALACLTQWGDVIVQDLLLDPPERGAHRPRTCPLDAG
jgi:hypothetical protein